MVPWLLLLGLSHPLSIATLSQTNSNLVSFFFLFPTGKIKIPQIKSIPITPSFHSILPGSPFDIDTGASPLAPRCVAINAVVAGSRAGSSPFGSVPFFGRQSGLLPFTIPGRRGFYRPRAAGGPCPCRSFAVERNSSSRRAKR